MRGGGVISAAVVLAAGAAVAVHAVPASMAAGFVPPDWPEESAQRLEKANALRELKLEPYPTRFDRSHSYGEIIAASGSRSE